ncbi:MAG: NAD(P)H-hydrate epimerase [Phycisphaerales bacterium]
MPLFFTRQNIRLLDQLAMTRYHIPGIVLMENAARQVVDYACAMAGVFSPSPCKEESRGEGETSGPPRTRQSVKSRRSAPHPNPLPEREGGQTRVLALAGGGNNGGDALAAARHLHNRGVAVNIALLRSDDTYTGDAKTNLNICRAMNLPITAAHDNPIDAIESLGPHDLILDGIFGTGLTGAVRSPFDELIAWVNEQECPILAIDIPSGMDCDTGKSLGAVIEAQLTVTFVGLKRGFSGKTSEQYTGRVVIADIGAPRKLIEELGQSL